MTQQNDREDLGGGQDESLIGLNAERFPVGIVVRHRGHIQDNAAVRSATFSRFSRHMPTCSDDSAVLLALLDPWYPDHHVNLGETLCTALVSQALSTASTRAVCVAPSA